MIENLKFAPSLEEQCSLIWDHYLSRRLKNELEPTWIHSPYQLVRDFLDKKSLSSQDFYLLKEVIKSHQQKDAAEVPVKTGFPKEGTRVMHDSWKAGSFTWIFMGRIFCEDIFEHKKYVIISRKLPDEIYNILDKDFAPQTLYGAYKVNKNSFFGPAISSDQLISHLDQQEPV
jgi:hypothetical protein